MRKKSPGAIFRERSEPEGRVSGMIRANPVKIRVWRSRTLSAAKPRLNPPKQPSELTIQRNFCGTRYHLSGDLAQKPLVVLIHGVGLNHTMWRAQVESLAPDFALLTYDFLGHGASHNPDGERKISDYTDQLADLVDHLDARRFALVGFSMGALIARAFASLQPKRVTHLGLLHSTYQRTEAERRSVRERYRMTRDHGPSALIEEAIERWFSPAYGRDQAEVITEIRAIFARHSGDGYLKAYRLFAHAEAEMRHYPPGIVSCPTLVITGADDPGSTPAMACALCRDLPNARLIINPHHRHMAPLEHAAVVSEQLRSLLSATECSGE